MIRKFDFRNRKATIQGNSGVMWEVPLGTMHINYNGGSRWVDMGMLLQERKANPVMFEDDLTEVILRRRARWPSCVSHLFGHLFRHILPT